MNKQKRNGGGASQPSEVKRLHREYAARGALAAGLLFNACVWPYVINENFSDSKAMESSDTDSPCDIRFTQQTGDDLEHAAKNCLADRYGKVAVVGYGISMPELIEAADKAMNVLSDGTNGLVRPEIVPVSLTSDAQKKFTEANLTCVRDNHENSGSYIADENMDLHEYGHVISFTNEKLCNGFAGGLTEPYKGSRYINIYNTADISKHESGTPGENNGMSDFIAHELGHAYGMGHADRLDLKEGGYDYFTPRIELISKDYEAAGVVVDLTVPTDILTNQQYLGYGGDANLMGRHSSYGIYANDAQQWQLQWPERALHQVSDKQRVLTEGVGVTPGSGEFVALLLNEPAIFKHAGSGGDISENVFTKLIFESVPGYEDYVNVYFATSDHINTLELGTIILAEYENETVTIKVGGQFVQLNSTPSHEVEFTYSTQLSADDQS